MTMSFGADRNGGVAGQLPASFHYPSTAHGPC